jgi:hypothetical protein
MDSYRASQLDLAISNQDFRAVELRARMILGDEGATRDEVIVACRAEAVLAANAKASVSESAWKSAAEGTATIDLRTKCGNLGKAAYHHLKRT